MRLQTTSPDTSSIGFTDGLDGVIDMTVAANRARKKMLDVVRKGAGEAFGEISRGVPKEYHGVLEGVKTLGRAAFDFITPSTERPTREQFIEESAMNLSPVPVAFGGVYTKRTLAAMKTLGEEGIGRVVDLSEVERTPVSIFKALKAGVRTYHAGDLSAGIKEEVKSFGGFHVGT